MIFKASGSFFHVKLFMLKRRKEWRFHSRCFQRSSLRRGHYVAGVGCLGADVIPSGFGGFEGLPFKLGGLTGYDFHLLQVLRQGSG